MYRRSARKLSFSVADNTHTSYTAITNFTKLTVILQKISLKVHGLRALAQHTSSRHIRKNAVDPRTTTVERLLSYIMLAGCLRFNCNYIG